MNHYALKRLRLAKNLTQKQLTDISGVSERTIRDIETGVNKEPDHDTLALLCKALCPETPSDFWEIVEDSIDYATETQILCSMQASVPSALYSPLSRLLNPEALNTTSYVVACITGHLHGGSWDEAIRDGAHWLLAAMAAVVQTSTLTTDATTFERHCHGLICDLHALSTIDAIPQDIAASAKTIVADLKCGHFDFNRPKLIIAVRQAFVLLYDNWDYVKDYGCTYTSLCNISLLCDNAKDTHDMRTSLFYAVIAHIETVSIYRACHSAFPREGRD